MKRSRALMLAAVPMTLLATLTACSPSSSNISEDASGAACAPEGAASKSIAIEGENFATAELTTKLPITSESLERSVLKDGTGDVFAADELVNMSYNMYNGATGELMINEANLEIPNSNELPEGFEWIYEGMRCASEGQQAAIVLPATERFGDDIDAAGIPDLTAKDSIVMVMDFSAAPEKQEVDLLDGPEGKEVKLPAGFPTISEDADGSPKIVMPEGEDAPKELTIGTLIEGEGAEVKPGDNVFVNYRGVIWSTGEEFDSSFSRGEPAEFNTTGVIPGFQKALEGERVGSRIISIVPAEDGGYGADRLKEMGHAPDAVMVFVLDILGVAPAAEFRSRK